ncbi:hypothetical protein GJAV_G00039000 [Gymnothorax javanicus]|nr:hypothetical protein GJAV_G00039000 [Gymnothorax javanicus]
MTAISSEMQRQLMTPASLAVTKRVLCLSSRWMFFPLHIQKVKIFIICACVVALSLFLLDRSARGGAVKQQQQNITVLLWHWPYRRSYSMKGDLCSDQFGISGCILTDRRDLFSSADVVVFHHHELKIKQVTLPLQLPRPPAQKWIWLSLEPPANNGPLSAYNGVFNWTMSYRLDSDIPIPYGKLQPKATSSTSAGSDNDENLVPGNKTHLACWVVSNYRSRYKRSKVYQRLKHVVNVEVYGRWVRKGLSNHDLLPTISRCYFYLAFENSQSVDYITEKLWRNSFLAGAVPIVLGPPRENYEVLVPGHSFIHVNDFNSTEEMGRFMQELAADHERYAQYFAWRHLYDIKMFTDWRQRLCEICRHYHRLDPSKVYYDLDGWVSGR